MTFERARRIADTVLHEGYLLYPYRASARKNQLRWQFGVLAPRAWSADGGCEAWSMQTECLVEPNDGVPQLLGQVRFLHMQRRSVERACDAAGTQFAAVDRLEVDGQMHVPWDEAVEHAIDVDAPLSCNERVWRFTPADSCDTEPITAASGAIVGRRVRRRAALDAVVRVCVERLDHTPPLLKIRVGVENLTACADTSVARAAMLPGALLSVHTLLALRGGAFVSLLDPPEWARGAAAHCHNVRTWPVLVGEPGARDVMLSSPIILYDYPEIAPESPTDFFDATEVDELLVLRTMTLTDDEKREARATDARAATLIDRTDALPPEMLERLHGAVRSLRAVTQPAAAPAPWWDPATDAAVSPETDSVLVHGVPVMRGSRVRLHPGVRRTDAQDMFLNGRVATVEGVFFDVDNHNYLAVTLEDDPAADLHQAHGRFLYFYPDEVEPLGAAR